MRNRTWRVLLSAAVTAALVALPGAGRAAPPGPPAAEAAPANAPPGVVRLTLDEAKQRALANSKLLNLAALNAESKAFAVKAAQADYFPKVTGSEIYLHFNDDLGTVLSTQGRTIRGPRGTPLTTFPPRSLTSRS